MKRIALMVCAVVAGAGEGWGAIIGALVPGSTSMVRTDDGSSAAASIGFTVNFFGSSYASLFVNNNGNATFGATMSAFTPTGLTASTGTKIIAPFLADVDTRNVATTPVSYGTGTITTNDSVVRNVFVANWVNVGYFNRKIDKLNSFQMILIDRSVGGSAGDFDIMFNYDQIQWETGDFSGGSAGLGGSSARAGFSNGAGNYYEFAGSGTPGSFLTGADALVTHTNVGLSDAQYTAENGRYVFAARNGEAPVASEPPAETPEPGSLVLLGLGCAMLVGYSRRGSAQAKRRA